MAWLKWDTNTCGGQYLEDLSTAYWYSEALFTALDIDLFEVLTGEGQPLKALAHTLNCDTPALGRFLHLLKTLDLVDCYQDTWYNTILSSTYLIKDSPLYQGNSILWRREIKADWETLQDALKAGRRVHFLPEDTTEAVLDERRAEYITAMDNIIQLKIPEILNFFGNGLNPEAKILDLGAGSGAFALGFLEAFPKATATLVDIRQVLPQTKKRVDKKSLSVQKRVSLHDQNILETHWNLENTYDLIILSNIVHAYAEEEIQTILKTAIKYLTPTGMLLIHDFFLEAGDIKAAFSDLNMFINTYNGKVFPSDWVNTTLLENNLVSTGLIPLSTDTGVIFAAQNKKDLQCLTITPLQQILQPIKSLGFHKLIPFNPKDVVLSPFAKNKCQFGCSSWDKKVCHSNGEMPSEETRTFINSFKTALLLKGEPPTGDFQRKALQAEITAFKAGYYKAFVFWAGPCSICPHCDSEAPCQNRAHTRPSMEGSGIDVFATVAKAGETLKTLSTPGEIIKYYALLLLE